MFALDANRGAHCVLHDCATDLNKHVQRCCVVTGLWFGSAHMGTEQHVDTNRSRIYPRNVRGVTLLTNGYE